MKVEIWSKVTKYIDGLSEPIKGRIIIALKKLEHDPPLGDIERMSGEDGYRLRVGKYRVMFDISDGIITIYGVGLRGQIYKKGGK